VVPLMIAATAATEPLMLLGGVSYHRFGNLADGAGSIRSDSSLLGYACRLPARGLNRRIRQPDGHQHVRQGLRTLSIATVIALRSRCPGLLLRAYRADQGFLQKISTCHVRLRSSRSAASSSAGLRHPHLAPRRTPATTPTLVSIHISVIFAVGALPQRVDLAKGSWGHCGSGTNRRWSAFLIVFLLYATYYPFSATRSRIASARPLRLGLRITRGAFVPLNFLACERRPRWSPRVSPPPRRPARVDDG